jgi:N-acetylneuraminate epimerase
MGMDLSVRQPGWKRLAEFPGHARDQALAVAVGRDVLVFGGAGHDPVEKCFRTFQDIHRYDTRADAWSVWPSCSPVPLMGAAVASVDEGVALFFGGVNDEVFNGFFRDSAAAAGERLDEIARAYLSMAPADYRFASSVRAFDAASNRWWVLDDLPGPACVGVALAARGRRIHLLGGEVKPGLRSTQVLRWELQDGLPASHRLPDLPAETDGAIAEGVAGALAASGPGLLVLAGGTQFPGARTRHLQGHAHAHEHLKKTWRRDIQVLGPTGWQRVGQLPCGLAHAQSFVWEGLWVIVGGESDGGEARPEAFAISLDALATSSRASSTRATPCASTVGAGR